MDNAHERVQCRVPFVGSVIAEKVAHFLVGVSSEFCGEQVHKKHSDHGFTFSWLSMYPQQAIVIAINGLLEGRVVNNPFTRVIHETVLAVLDLLPVNSGVRDKQCTQAFST